jgi:HEAT repeat protein
MSVTSESVRALLDSSDFGDRLRAVNQLRQLEREIGFELILRAVNDAHPRVRYAAVSQLATLGQHNLSQASAILRGRLRDPDPDVQAAAADSIGALQLTEAFEELQQLYNTSSEWLVRFSIVAGLGSLGDRRGFEMLVNALDSDNELLKTVAIGSLGELGDRRAIGLLTPYATDPDWQIRFRVVQALGHLDGPDVRDTLQAMAQDTVEQVAQEARSYLKS